MIQAAGMVASMFSGGGGGGMGGASQTSSGASSDVGDVVLGGINFGSRSPDYEKYIFIAVIVVVLLVLLLRG